GLRELVPVVDRDPGEYEVPGLVGAEQGFHQPVAALLEVGQVDGIVDVPVVVDVAPADRDRHLVHGADPPTPAGPELPRTWEKAPDGGSGAFSSERGAPRVVRFAPEGGSRRYVAVVLQIADRTRLTVRWEAGVHPGGGPSPGRHAPRSAATR